MATAKTDRTWALPKSPWVMRMTWSELLFAHWPVDPKVLVPLLPPGLTLDIRDGLAWIGVMPFQMSNIAARCSPPLPMLSRFLELNVRTYVTHNGKPGVWFFSLDAANRLAVRVARATFNLPYMDAKMSLTENDRSLIDYQSQRTHRNEPSAKFAATYQPTGEPFFAQPATLEHWLTARYCLYSANRKGNLFRGEIDHAPWTLAPANWTPRENSMCDPLNLELVGHPHLLFVKSIEVRAWMACRCG